MGVLAVATVLCLCLSTAFATYGPDYKNHGGDFKHHDGDYKHHDGDYKHHDGDYKYHGSDYKNHGPNHGASYHHDSKIKLDEAKIHLDSPKIILDRPSINFHGGGAHGLLHGGGAHGLLHGGGAHGLLHGGGAHGLLHDGGAHGLVHGGGSHGNVHGPIEDDEPIILENEKPLYVRKTLHGISSAPVYAAHGPVIVGGGYSSGKVLNYAAPVPILNHAPLSYDRPILIRRPVVVSKSLTSTQDHLEKLHYAHTGLAHGYSLGGLAHGYAIPVSRALHEKTVVYGGYGGHGYGGHGYGGHGYGGHGYGHGLGIIPAYSAPVILEAPKAYVGHAGIASGKVLHGGALLHGHGGAILHGHGGAVLHDNGGHLHGASLKKH